jgi:octaprenyl-diphosphate synthase
MLAAETRADAVPATSTLRLESPSQWKRIIDPLEPFLNGVSERLALQVENFDPAIVPYAEYVLSGQGKQLRPALVSLAGGAVGEVNDNHTTIAVIIEMVHLATLVHDDVMDEADLRRGRPTVAANWGNEIAVLFGDCLFAQALKLAASFPTPEICRAVAMATNTVCAGEILQTRSRRNFELARAEYFKVLEMKTAELFALSCELGAFLAGSGAEERKALRDYGFNLGTAYQIYDDCLDVFGSEAKAGKSLGTDLMTGKLTLPVLLLWERSDREGRDELQKMVNKWKTRDFDRILALMNQFGTRAATLEVIEDYLARARESLRDLGDSLNRQGLLELTGFLSSQAASLGRAV